MAEGIFAPDGSYNVTIKGGTVEVDPTGLATDANQTTMITALQLIDDVVQTEDAVHSSGQKGIMALGVRSNSPTLLATEGDYTTFILDQGGRIHVRESVDEYETVAASQTNQVLGPTGAAGDIIRGILVIPASVSPGNVILLDNATSITVFAGGTDSVLTLHPFFIPLGLRSVSGSWRITTGANVSCIAIGDFT